MNRAVARRTPAARPYTVDSSEGLVVQRVAVRGADVEDRGGGLVRRAVVPLGRWRGDTRRVVGDPVVALGQRPEPVGAVGSGARSDAGVAAVGVVDVDADVGHRR